MADVVELGMENLRTEIAPVVQRAGALVVHTPEHRTEAMEFLKAVKGAQKRVGDFFGPLVDAAHKSWKRTTEARASVLGPLEAAEKTVKATILTYDQEQERIRLDEQRRLQAIADEEARKERERLEKQAAKLKTPELKEQRLEEAAAIVAPVVTVSAPEKQKGEATVTRWKAKLTDKGALVRRAATGDGAADSLLAFDQSAADRLAVATKGVLKIPGVEFYAEKSLAVRGGR